MSDPYADFKFDPRFVAAIRATPVARQQADGTWARDWHVEFAQPANLSESIAQIEASLSTAGKGQIEERLLDFSVKLRFAGLAEAIISITTRRPATEDDYLFTTGRILERLQEHCGTIVRIQGHDRDLWMPWAFPQLFGGSLLHPIATAQKTDHKL